MHRKLGYLFILIHIAESVSSSTIKNNIESIELNSEMDSNEINSPPNLKTFKNWLFIYPGTKWCGAGNISKTYDDLGYLRETDKCCRTHDHCDNVILGHTIKYNLKNPRFYSRLHCTCDQEFHRCLKIVSNDDPSAMAIGNIYFNALGTQCFREDYPVTKCLKYTYFPIRKCIGYEYNFKKEKLYQWFDMEIF